jgi:hypothetical protein
MRAAVDPVRTVIAVLVQGLVGTGRGEAGSGVLQLPHCPRDDRSLSSTALSLCLRRIGCRSVQRVSGEHPEVLLADFLTRLMESGEEEWTLGG